jgi:hypothetical protein
MSSFVQFHNFPPSLLHYSKFYSKISGSSEFWKFWTHHAKAMAKNQKVNIAVTYVQVYNFFISE